METKVYEPLEYKKIIKDIKDGQVVGFPTETVYGLGIIYDNEDAKYKLADAKNRAITKPISMMVHEGFDFEEVCYLNENAKKVINHFMPGALTIILKAKESIPEFVTMGSKTIGIRIPTNEIALKILKEVSKPMLVTSANIAGEESLMKAKDVYNTFNGKIASLINEDAINGVASTVVDLSTSEIKILREGPISLEDIKKVIEEE